MTLRSARVTISPETVNHERQHQRFPSVQPEDFVQIRDETWVANDETPPIASKCRSIPERLRTLYYQLPKRAKIICGAGLFVILFLLAIGIVLFIFLVLPSSSESNSHIVVNTSAFPSTDPPWLLKARITEVGFFLLDLDPAMAQTLGPDAVEKDRFLAFDQVNTLRVVTKQSSMKITVDKIILNGTGLERQNGTCTILGVLDDCLRKGWCENEEYVYCCTFTNKVLCSLFGQIASWEGVLSGLSLRSDDALHIVTRNQDTNGCTLQHTILSKETYSAGASTECGWAKFQMEENEDVPYAVGIYSAKEVTFSTKALVSRNGDLLTGAISDSTPQFYVPGFGNGPYFIAGLSASPDLLVGSLKNDSFSIAKVSKEYVSFVKLNLVTGCTLISGFFLSSGTLEMLCSFNNTLVLASYVIDWRT